MTDRICESAFKLCRWAEAEIQHFEAVRDAFLSANKTEVIQTVSPTTGRNVVYPTEVTVSPQVLDQWERSAYRIVSDLRNALDHASHAASVFLGSTCKTKTNFPMLCNEKDFDTNVPNPKGNFRGIPTELHGKLKALGPFWRFNDGRKGNLVLRTIGEIANPNKHRVTIGVGFILGGTIINTAVDVGFLSNPREGRVSNRDRPELHWWVKGPRPELNIDFVREVRLNDAGIFSHRDASHSFRQMLDETSRAVAYLDQECRQILASRSA